MLKEQILNHLKIKSKLKIRKNKLMKVYLHKYLISNLN